MKLSSKKRNILIVVIFLVCVCGYYSIIADTSMKGDAESITTTHEEISKEHGNKENQDASSEKGKVLVYVTGAVEEPGLYELTSPVTVKAAIEASKGLLPYADVNRLHMEETIDESTHLHVDFNFRGNPEELLRRQNISINDSSEAELQKISGIGPKMAKKIVDYRNEHGPFKQLEDLKHVKGIGPALYKKIVEKVRL